MSSLIQITMLYHYHHYHRGNTHRHFLSPKHSSTECSAALLTNPRFRIFREIDSSLLRSNCDIHGPSPLPPMISTEESPPLPSNLNLPSDCGNHAHWHHCPELHRAFNGVQYIADYTKREEDSNKVGGPHNYISIVFRGATGICFAETFFF